MVSDPPQGVGAGGAAAAKESLGILTQEASHSSETDPVTP